MDKELIKNQVSVIIATYKRTDVVVRAVESALHQTCDTNVIVIDDNGKDTPEQLKTAEVLRPYNDRITYLVNETNLGPSGTRNHGIQHASGEFITFLDDDDEIKPEKLERQMNCLNEKGEEYSICYCDYTKLLENGSTYLNGETIEGDVYPYMLGRMVFVGSGSNILVRTKVLLEAGLFNEKLRRYEDFELMCRLLKNHKLAYLPENLFTIHYEVRAIIPPFSEIQKYDHDYYEIVSDEIETLPEKQKKLIKQSASLMQWRLSLSYLSKKKSFQILRDNHVPITLFIRYLLYLTDRLLTKRSYGFKPF